MKRVLVILAAIVGLLMIKAALPIPSCPGAARPTTSHQRLASAPTCQMEPSATPIGWEVIGYMRGAPLAEAFTVPCPVATPDSDGPNVTVTPIHTIICNGVCADGNTIQVHGRIYNIADDRPGCFVRPAGATSKVVFYPDVRTMPGDTSLGFEVACP
jgi:hypothetical protein